jgi:ABC-type Mn2+/Zn2+ transport system permease subunit
MTGTLFSFAYLILPGATALRFTRRPWSICLTAVLVALAADAIGFIAAVPLDLPPGPASAAAAFFLFLLGRLAVLR